MNEFSIELQSGHIFAVGYLAAAHSLPLLSPLQKNNQRNLLNAKPDK
jgi:hypothetical protein